MIKSLEDYKVIVTDKTLSARVNGENVEIVAKMNEKGKFEPTISLSDIEDKSVREKFLSMFTRAELEIRKEQEKIADRLEKGINGYLGIHKEADLNRKSFMEKVAETTNKPFLKLQSALYELKNNISTVIKEHKTYPIYFDSYKSLKETTQKVDYVASALTNPATADLAESIVNSESVGKALYARIDEINRISKLAKPIAEYDNNIRRILHGDIDHYDTARAISECMDAINKSLELEKMVELTEEVYNYAGKSRDKALEGYNYTVHALCRKMSEYMGGMPTPFVNVININNTELDDTQYVKENFPKEFGVILDNLTDKNTDLGIIDKLELKAVKTPYYKDRPCFELTCYNKMGTSFNLMFNPDCEVCQICKKRIDEEQGKCIFNNTNLHQWIDLSATGNGESKAMIDSMPFVKKSLDKFVKDRGMANTHEQVFSGEKGNMAKN